MVRVKKLGNCMDYPTVAKPAKVHKRVSQVWPEGTGGTLALQFS